MEKSDDITKPMDRTIRKQESREIALRCWLLSDEFVGKMIRIILWASHKVRAKETRVYILMKSAKNPLIYEYFCLFLFKSFL